MIVTFMNDFYAILTPQLHQLFVDSVVQLIRHYCETIKGIPEMRSQFNDRQVRYNNMLQKLIFQYFNVMYDLKFFEQAFAPVMEAQIGVSDTLSATKLIRGIEKIGQAHSRSFQLVARPAQRAL